MFRILYRVQRKAPRRITYIRLLLVACAQYTIYRQMHQQHTISLGSGVYCVMYRHVHCTDNMRQPPNETKDWREKAPEHSYLDLSYFDSFSFFLLLLFNRITLVDVILHEILSI